MNAFRAALTSREPVESIDDGMAMPTGLEYVGFGFGFCTAVGFGAGLWVGRGVAAALAGAGFAVGSGEGEGEGEAPDASPLGLGLPTMAHGRVRSGAWIRRTGLISERHVSGSRRAVGIPVGEAIAVGGTGCVVHQAGRRSSLR